MNKRLKKKKQKELIMYVKMEISESSEWRNKLDLADPETVIPIPKAELVKLIPWQSSLIRKCNPEYVVFKQRLPDSVSYKQVLFIFTSSRFPTITDWSWNDLNVI